MNYMARQLWEQSTWYSLLKEVHQWHQFKYTILSLTDTHRPPAGVPCSVVSCRLTRTSEWPRSHHFQTLEHICCLVLHLVFTALPISLSTVAAVTPACPAGSCSKTGSINHLGRVTLMWTQVVHGHTLHRVSGAEDRHNKHKEVVRPDKRMSQYRSDITSGCTGGLHKSPCCWSHVCHVTMWCMHLLFLIWLQCQHWELPKGLRAVHVGL